MSRSNRKWEAWQRSLQHCAYCGQKLSFPWLSVDHIVPLSRGGARKQSENLIGCCQPCNENKANMMVDEYREYLGVERLWIEEQTGERLTGLSREEYHERQDAESIRRV